MKNILLLLLFAAANLFAQTNNEPVAIAIDGYAARVDNTIITYGDIRESLSAILPQVFQRYQGEELAQQIQRLHLESRETLIEEALIQAEAKSLGMSLPEAIVDEEVNNIIRERFDGSRTQFNQALAARRMTLEEWREEISDRLLMQAYYSREVFRNVHISEEDIQAEYERTQDSYSIPFRVKYRFILINKGATEEEQAIKHGQAEETLKKLHDGADFAELAADVSEGDTSLSPWRDPADVKKVMRPALHDLAAGEISDLIEADTVFYIIKVESRQEEGYTPLNDVREAIERQLAEQERERRHNQLVERLSAKHYIERY